MIFPLNMVIFDSYVNVYQRVVFVILILHVVWDIFGADGSGSPSFA